MDTDTSETGRLLMGSFKRLHHILHHTLFRSLSPQLKPSSLFVMMRLKRAAHSGSSGVRVSDIASTMGISTPGITQILTTLEKDGYVRREMDSEDRRAVRVFLTESGENIMAPAFRQLEESFSGMIDHLGAENSRTLASLLDQVEKYFIGVTGGCTAPGKEE